MEEADVRFPDGGWSGLDDRRSSGDTVGSATSGSRMVVVPRLPGPLRNLDMEGGRDRDELDEFIEEAFGKTTDERPGLFDAGLVMVGLGLLAWGFLLGGSDLVRWVGAIATLLGIALPARSLVRRYGEQRTRWARRRVMGDGTLLDIGHPSTLALAQAFEDLLEVAALPGASALSHVTTSALHAVMEVASLLEGSSPVAEAQISYVARRTEAIRELTSELLRVHRRWVVDATTEADERTAEALNWATALTAAREELETAERVGALAEMDLLTTQLRQDAADARP